MAGIEVRIEGISAVIEKLDRLRTVIPEDQKDGLREAANIARNYMYAIAPKGKSRQLSSSIKVFEEELNRGIIKIGPDESNPNLWSYSRGTGSVSFYPYWQEIGYQEHYLPQPWVQTPSLRGMTLEPPFPMAKVSRHTPFIQPIYNYMQNRYVEIAKKYVSKSMQKAGFGR